MYTVWYLYESLSYITVVFSYEEVVITCFVLPAVGSVLVNNVSSLVLFSPPQQKNGIKINLFQILNGLREICLEPNVFWY